MGAAVIVIIGAGGHGKEVASYLRDMAADGGPTLLGFIDDHHPRGRFSGSDVLGGVDVLARLCLERTPQPIHYITAVGNNEARKSLVARLEEMRLATLRPWTLIHPTAYVGAGVQIGEGTCLAPGSVVTAEATIGRHCILNVHVSVSHDCVVHDFTNVNPAATVCGSVRIGEGCYIGAGATLIDRISIGEWSIVGGGAVVIRDLPSRVTAVGVPARPLVKQKPS